MSVARDRFGIDKSVGEDSEQQTEVFIRPDGNICGPPKPCTCGPRPEQST